MDLFKLFFCNKHHTTSNNSSWSAWRDRKAGPVNWAVGSSSLFLVTQFKQKRLSSVSHSDDPREITPPCKALLGQDTAIGTSGCYVSPAALCLLLAFRRKRGKRRTCKPVVPPAGYTHPLLEHNSDCEGVLQSCISHRGSLPSSVVIICQTRWTGVITERDEIVWLLLSTWRKPVWSYVCVWALKIV